MARWLLLLLRLGPCLAFVVKDQVLRRPWKRPKSWLAAARSDGINKLLEWADAVADIEMNRDALGLTATEKAGLGFVAKDDLKSNQVLLQVPDSVAVTVEVPGEGPNDNARLERACRQCTQFKFRELPWYVQFSLYLNSDDALRQDRGPWLDSLPRQMGTPIHWTAAQLEDLQYAPMTQAVQKQDTQWKDYYQQVTTDPQSPFSSSSLSWKDFLWGCEMARSRAFSSNTAGRFNPGIYAFTLLLVIAYVGLGFGTLEQAANGAGVVVSATILSDFVLPKLLQKDRQKYVICPVIDMANHASVASNAQVSLEYFARAYSLATTLPIAPNAPVTISYGARSNDQLLQYYGFCEGADNPNDVYMMPPLGEWPLPALEAATGRTVAAGRLEKLSRAGLLATNVVVNRIDGVDPAVVSGLRALFSTDSEWDQAGQAVGNFATAVSAANERAALLAAQTAVQLELDAKPTTLADDVEQLKTAKQQQEVTLMFRIAKKRLLQDTIDNLKKSIAN